MVRHCESKWIPPKVLFVVLCTTSNRKECTCEVDAVEFCSSTLQNSSAIGKVG